MSMNNEIMYPVTTYRGRIAGISGHPMNGLWTLIMEDGITAHVGSEYGAMALAAAFGATEGSVEALQEKLLGQEVVYSVDGQGVLLGFTPAPDWAGPAIPPEGIVETGDAGDGDADLADVDEEPEEDAESEVLPTRPEHFISQFNAKHHPHLKPLIDLPEDDRPKQAPRTGKFIGSTEWTWGPVHDRLDRYFISTNRKRSHWILWRVWLDDNWGRWEHDLYAYGPKKDVDMKTAAIYLLMDAWSFGRDQMSLEHYHVLNRAGLLSDAEFKAIGRQVWPQEKLPPNGTTGVGPGDKERELQSIMSKLEELGGKRDPSLATGAWIFEKPRFPPGSTSQPTDMETDQSRKGEEPEDEG